ncbi:hypothetical protein GCM10010441_47690 [Kitasatospora paracochleata]|uniref:GH92 family glycosyl hydrolase n=1 Tax=Kitasatospora paracochleata TaxID=58354 RepID=UPI0031DE3B75
MRVTMRFGASSPPDPSPRVVHPAPRGRAAVVLLALLTALVPQFAAAGSATASATSNVDLVNPFIGTTGSSESEYGGMLPTPSPPFAMTRWSPMTRNNYVSAAPYRLGDPKITGFIGTHQPAIWMGDSGYVVGMPGVGAVRTAEADRGLPYSHSDETAAPDKYTVNMHPAPGQTLRAELTGTSRVGVLRLTYPQGADTNFVVQATRAGITGNVHIDPAKHEISGYNPDRQDRQVSTFKAPNFKGYFVARFDTAFAGYGTASGATQLDGQADFTGEEATGYARFPAGTVNVNVRIATSFISVDQARANLDKEAPDGQSFAATAAATRAAWAEKLDRVHIQGATPDQLAVFYTAMFHALQYPSEMSEHGRYYSAYDDKVHNGVSYTGYSLWDTFRAENAFLTLFAPERIDDMVTSMLQDYQQGGWLPMWKNITETNVMVGTNADSIIAEDLAKGFHGFDLNLAYQAVHKDAMTPPDQDTTLWYGPGDKGNPVEARAGLTTYLQNGWVAADHTSEAGSRTLDYAYEDWAVAQVAKAVGNTSDATYFLNRSNNYKKLYNPSTGFMQARNLDGSWASGSWAEGNQWIYTNDVLHDPAGLIALKGGDAAYSDWLDGYFAGGHNNQTNEPSHHAPYMYDYTGRPWRTQQLVRQIADSNYHNTTDGLSGNEDCGQMSAWYLFSAMGFYPVNPASGQYAVGSPFFDKVTLDLPGAHRPLVISSPKAPSSPYVQALSLNGKSITQPVLSHSDLTGGGELDFTMNTAPQAWAAKTTPPPAPVVNLAEGKPAQMLNGTPGWGGVAEKAVDGNPSTMAQSSTSAPWSLQVDLGATTAVGKAVVTPDWENYPVSYDIQTSTDGANWTTVAGEASSGGTAGCAAHGVTTCGQTHTYTFAATQARYLRLSVKSWVSAKTGAPAAGYGWALAEFQVYAPTGSPSPSDHQAPTTTATLDPASPTGLAGWYTSSVKVALAATDEAGGSGVARTEYRVDGAAWKPYSAAVTVSGDGTHTVSYRSSDKAGNTETVRTATVRIDGTAPTVLVGGVSDGGTYGDSTALPVSVTASDAGSGTSSVTATLDGRAYALPGTPLTPGRLSLGRHELIATAKDRAGNATVVKVAFEVTTSLEDMGAIVDQAVEAQRLDQGGANKLHARIAQVQATEDRGKAKQVVNQLQILQRMIGGTADVRLGDADRALLDRDVRFLIAAAGGPVS